MSAYRYPALVALFFLFACSPLKPDTYTTIVPAGPLVQYLEQRGRSFSGLKGLAHLEVEKRGRKRRFDSVGIVLDDQRRFRLEAYDPIGQSLMVVLWNGKSVQMRLPDEDKVVQAGPAGFENILGKGLEPLELSAILSGNIPEIREAGEAIQRCNQEGVCIVELHNRNTIRRMKVAHPVAQSNQNPELLSYESYRSNTLLFRARFARVEEVSGYLLPMQIVIECPDQDLQLTIEYNDVELNSPISDDVFTLAE